MNIQFLRRIKFYILGIIIGSICGFTFHLIINQDPLIKEIFLGSALGLFVTILIPIFRPELLGYKCKEIHLSIPQFSELTFYVDDSQRHVAWSLFIETITRISSQPLNDEGFVREALHSIYSLFQITRDSLKSMEPSKDSEKNKTTVEMFAISMLNNVLRPFLAKWHPLLTIFETNHPNKSEKEWEFNAECRRELEEVRSQILNYAQGFGELADVKHLDYFIKK